MDQQIGPDGGKASKTHFSVEHTSVYIGKTVHSLEQQYNQMFVLLSMC